MAPGVRRGGTRSASPRPPLLDLPFPSRCNPELDGLAAHLRRRIGDSGLIEEAALPAWESGRYERLVGRMFPAAPEPLLNLIGEAVLWLFLVDDHLDPGRPGGDPACAERLRHGVVRVLAGERGEDPLPRWLCRWCPRIRDIAGPRWWSRCAADLRDFTTAICDEVGARTDGVPALEAYVPARRLTSGWGVLSDLVELDSGAEGIRSAALWSELRWTAADVACAVNDILSLRKEVEAGEQHNLVFVLAVRGRRSIPDAVEVADQWLRRRLSDYLDVRERFVAADRHRGGAGAARYARGLEHLMRGSRDWSVETGRYEVADHE
ncbi:terpene synthase family protein [Actinomadura rubrisoli]|uniref:Terpene synthase n=1 Tax=Actinomadura rubrisoli TaxID=2530368 RepID=A0A4R5AQB0_9ACTN|nr:hypothetical protein [Actinomadura rubrisoli]TDD75071.1 hypothetical protein E1298_31935 [Actinomadura rubrisoli]